MKHTFRSLAFVACLLGTAGCVATTASKPEDSVAVTKTLYQAAQNAEQANDYKAAIQYYQKLRMRIPDNPDIVLALARNLRYSGSEDEAIYTLEQTGLLDDTNPAFLIEYSKLKIAIGKSEEAIIALEKAVQISPDNWEVYSISGVAFDMVEDFVQARSSYEKALNLSPDNPDIYNNMAISAALSGDLEEAISILNDVPRLLRNHAQLRQNLAFFYGIKGDVKSAETLARTDLDEESVRKNLQIYSQFRAY